MFARFAFIVLVGLPGRHVDPLGDHVGRVVLDGQAANPLEIQHPVERGHIPVSEAPPADGSGPCQGVGQLCKRLPGQNGGT